MENNVSILNCPACGAALDLDGSSLVIRCKFCGNVVQVSGAIGNGSGVVPAQPATITPALEEIRQLARAGKMLEAIKRYRAMYDVGLAEAKADIKALQANRWVGPSGSPRN